MLARVRLAEISHGQWLWRAPPEDFSLRIDRYKASYNSIITSGSPQR
jgi:hypothetical protein